MLGLAPYQRNLEQRNWVCLRSLGERSAAFFYKDPFPTSGGRTEVA